MPPDDDGGTDERRRAADRWQRVSHIVDVALELDIADRAGCVAEYCVDDADLRREVEQFLAACEVVERSGTFLNEPAHRHVGEIADAIAGQLATARASLPQMVAAALAGRYDIKNELGTGGAATVFRALDVSANGDVAIKVFHAGLSRTIGSERFLREVRITSLLRHPNILPVLDAGVAGELLYYVMPCVEGQTLRDRLKREQQLSVETALAIARDVAAALDEAHRRGFVHRDVKPQNILLDGDRAFVADFGIAHAMESAATDRLTETGTLLGTPAYMSPEQAAGESTIDRRSDVYSLACVVYEMLVGEPPFSGTSTKAVLAKHILAPVPDVRVVRPSLSPAVNQVLARGLAKLAADRYESASEFVEAVALASTGPRGDPGRRQRLVAGAVGALVLIGFAATMMRVPGRASAAAAVLDTATVAVLPFEHDDGAQAGAGHDDLLRESLTRWSGVSVVDRFQVADAVRRRGAIRSADDATTIARGLGAGRLVRGRWTSQGRVSRLYLALYDTRDGKALYNTAAEVPSDPAAAKDAYARLADSLLLRGAAGAPASFGKPTSRSLPAMQAISRALAALDNWELSAADSAFEAALGFDVRDPWTNLWAAQVRAWRGRPSTSWSTASARAVENGTVLSVRERALARALTALANGNFASACGEYDALRRENVRDFAAWYGLGQCRRMDMLVVHDPSSPSKWRFRSSYDSALTAFSTAFEILPTALRAYEPGSFERLRDLLLLSTALVLGRSADSASFYARPGLLHNRVVLVPYPWQRVSAGDPSTIPPGFDRAMTVQRDRFRKIAGTWSAAFPRSAAAKNAVALSLELMRDTRAIDTLRLARRISTDSAQRRSFATAEVLLLVKFGVSDHPALLAGAARLADSLLDAAPSSPHDDPARLAALAVLRGRCAAAQSFSLRVPAPSPVLQERAQQVSALSEGLGVRAGLGCKAKPGELSALSAAADTALQFLPPSERGQYLEHLLFRPALLAPTMDSGVVDRLGRASSNPLLGAARAFVRHDNIGARAALTAFSSAWRETSGPVTPDVALPESRLFLALGDTAAATVWMDRSLGHAIGYDPEVLGDAATLASLVRLMVLRTQVAARRGDEATARRWAPMVFALWSTADPELRGDLEPLRRFARAP